MDLSPELSSMANALVGANDQLLALYDLLEVTTDSLEEVNTVLELLKRAFKLLDCDALLVLTDDINHFYGDEAERDTLNQAPDDLDRASVAIERATTAFGLEAELRALRRESPFSTGDRKLMKAVLQTVLGAIHTSRLHQESLQQAIVAHDHRTAAAIAQVALPDGPPELTGIDFFARSDPAHAAGGDLYMYAVVGENLCFVVGDVSGKGVSAAMMMTTITSAANASFHDLSSYSPVEHLRRISQWTYDHLAKADLFTTLVVGRYCTTDGTLTLANAGHSPVFIVRKGKAEPSYAHVPPVGVLPVGDVDAAIHQLGLGEAIVVASDGIVEQESAEGEQFGEHRLIRHLERYSNQPASVMGTSMFDEVASFGEDHTQDDDRTLLIVKRAVKP